MRIAVLFRTIGPYHQARLRAAAQIGDVVAVELVPYDSAYGWSPVPSSGPFERITLFANEEEAESGSVWDAAHGALEAAAPDVVAVPGWSTPLSYAGLSWATARGRRAVLMSESTERDAPRARWRELGKSLLVRQCAAAVVGGARQAAYAARLGIPRDRVFQGYASVDNHYFESRAEAVRGEADAARRRAGLPRSFFLASARFVTRKNLPNLLRAYALYREAAQGGPAWALVVLGDGPLRGRLTAQVAQAGLGDSVSLPGFRQYEELPTYYALAGAFVHASSVEQWGLVVNEAMASGLPVLVSRACGCASDLVHEGVNGFSFEPHDPHELARLMLRLAAADCPRADMGAASRRIVHAWRPERFARSLWEAASLPARSDGAARRILAIRLARLASRLSGAWS